MALLAAQRACPPVQQYALAHVGFQVCLGGSRALAGAVAERACGPQQIYGAGAIADWALPAPRDSVHAVTGAAPVLNVFSRRRAAGFARVKIPGPQAAARRAAPIPRLRGRRPALPVAGAHAAAGSRVLPPPADPQACGVAGPPPPSHRHRRPRRPACCAWRLPGGPPRDAQPYPQDAPIPHLPARPPPPPAGAPRRRRPDHNTVILQLRCFHAAAARPAPDPLPGTRLPAGHPASGHAGAAARRKLCAFAARCPPPTSPSADLISAARSCRAGQGLYENGREADRAH